MYVRIFPFLFRQYVRLSGKPTYCQCHHPVILTFTDCQFSSRDFPRSLITIHYHLLSFLSLVARHHCHLSITIFNRRSHINHYHQPIGYPLPFLFLAFCFPSFPFTSYSLSCLLIHISHIMDLFYVHLFRIFIFSIFFSIESYRAFVIFFNHVYSIFFSAFLFFLMLLYFPMI